MNQGKRGDGCHHPGVGLGEASEEWGGVGKSGEEGYFRDTTADG